MVINTYAGRKNVLSCQFLGINQGKMTENSAVIS